MLDSIIQNLITDNIDEAIEKKTLSKDLLQLVYDHNWFNLWVPKVYGGLELSLVEGCKLLENLAYEDGGLGWTVTLCSGANMFAGFIDPKDAEIIFRQADVCWGGSGQVSGRADYFKDHYIIDGSWKYATGAPHLSHFTLNAWVYENDKPILNREGIPIYHSFYVDRDDVLIHYDWETFGLEVTASHSFSINKLKLPASRAFELQPTARTSQATVYEYPFSTFAECTLVVNYIGMFRKFIKLLEDYLIKKSVDKDWYTRKGKEQLKDCDQVSNSLDSLCNRLYELIETTWKAIEIEETYRTEITCVSKEIVRLVKTETARLFPYAGILGAQKSSPINRVFRNLFTASQHSMLSL